MPHIFSMAQAEDHLNWGYLPCLWESEHNTPVGSGGSGPLGPPG